MTTDDVFHEWINKQDWIKWKDPESVRKAFILWGDYVKDKYAEFRLSSVSGSLPSLDDVAKVAVRISEEAIKPPKTKTR